MAQDIAADAADQRWTIRGVDKAHRDAAASAANRLEMPVGAWLCNAIDYAIRAEREPAGTGQGAPTKTTDMALLPAKPRGRKPPQPRDPAEEMTKLALVRDRIATAKAMWGDNWPPGVREGMEAQVRARMPRGRRWKAPALAAPEGTPDIELDMPAH
jgi:hypothetical protein